MSLKGIVVGLEPMRNAEGSEIVTVQTLLGVLNLKGVCFSLDALHAQKKRMRPRAVARRKGTRTKQTVQQIIESGNDYLIAVKANQPKLFKQLKSQFEQVSPLSVDCQTERTRDRVCQRKVSVLDSVSGIDPQWVGLQRIIRVERSGTRGQKPFEETVFYISSLTLDAPGFAGQIRTHWQIENRLHWPKDVVLQEDKAPLCDGHAPSNFAIARTIAVNLFRANDFASITKGIRHLAHDVHRLFSFFQ